MSVSVCVLMYGDHVDLARRCLASLEGLERAGPVADVRLGFNDPCAATLAYARGWARDLGAPAYGFHARGFVGATPVISNVGKYPLMRRMFYPAAVPAPAELILWIDDDSFVSAAAGPRWLGDMVELFDDVAVGLAGEPWYARYVGAQEAGYRAQPWFTGRPELPPANPRCPESRRFAQGGGWMARRDFLARWDYPFPELHHNGGDVALGRLVFEQGWRLAEHRGGLVRNAASRRGLSQPPAWAARGSRQPRDHHRFAHVEECLNDLARPESPPRPWPGFVGVACRNGWPAFLCSPSEGTCPPSYAASPGSTSLLTSALASPPPTCTSVP